MSANNTTGKWYQTPRARRVGQVMAGLGVLGVIFWFFAFRPYVSTDDARVAATLVRIAPEGVSGKVIVLNVKEGDRVKQGQVLAELDHGIAAANLEKAKARASQSEKELRRMEQLAKQNGIPSRDLETARAADAATKAELSLAQIAFDRTFLKSAIDGVVVQKVAEVGNILEANQTALTVADVDHAYISANIQETEVSAIKPGQEVRVRVDEGGELWGKVTEVRSATASTFALIQAENPSGNFTKLVQRIPIRVDLDGRGGQALRAGQSVVIRIRVK